MKPAKTNDFQLGRCVLTQGAQFAIQEAGQSPVDFLNRHALCDWGDVCRDDWKMNDESLSRRERVFSAYTTRKGQRLWVITEAGYLETTILTPEEY